MIYKTTDVTGATQMSNQPETSFFRLGIAPKILDFLESIEVKENKPRLRGKLLAQYHGSVLLFSRTKHNARKMKVSIRNNDLPEDAENYVHRIGCSARAGSHGHAISFATPDQGCGVREIEKIIGSLLLL